MHPAYKEALEAYANPFHELEIEPLTSGLINQSYKVTSKYSGESFLLQQINNTVFNDPGSVQSNYEKLWVHIKNQDCNKCIPAPKFFPGNHSLFCDSQERYWRVFEFKNDSSSLHVANDPVIAKKVAEVFACFTSCFTEFDIESLTPTISGFHNLAERYRQFEDAAGFASSERMENARKQIGLLKQKAGYVNFYEVITESEEFPLRVMHHDAKISNVLFEKNTMDVICAVDLDTAMPGYFFSDLGDMIRSMASCKDENSIDLAELCIRDEYYEAILEGYMSKLKVNFTAAEKKYIHSAGLLMIYMQALRFMSDYLRGDIYYKTDYPEQNFDRTNNQIGLLLKLEEFLSEKYNFRIL